VHRSTKLKQLTRVTIERLLRASFMRGRVGGSPARVSRSCRSEFARPTTAAKFCTGSADEAVAQAQAYIIDRYEFVVDIDLVNFF